MEEDLWAALKAKVDDMALRTRAFRAQFDEFPPRCSKCAPYTAQLDKAVEGVDHAKANLESYYGGSAGQPVFEAYEQFAAALQEFMLAYTQWFQHHHEAHGAPVHPEVQRGFDALAAAMRPRLAPQRPT